MRKSIIYSIASFAAVLLVAVGVVYAWYTLTPTVRVGEFIVNVNNYEARLALKVKKNNDAFYTNVGTKEEIASFFYNTVPGDCLYFCFTVTNAGAEAVTANIWLADITSETADPDYNMLDVFYIKEGVVTVNESPVLLPVNSEDEAQAFGQQLSVSRLENLISATADIRMASGVFIASGGFMDLEFALVYDCETEAKGYETGVLSIGSINVLFDIKKGE